jgi:Family of unknown function (DUF5677)
MRNEDPRTSRRCSLQRERARIVQDCHEWFENGKLRKRPHWTAEKEADSLKKLALKVGLEDDYRAMYSLTSKYIHGSSLLRNTYRTGCVGNPRDNCGLALMACSHCIDLLKALATFFGVPYATDDELQWHIYVSKAHEMVPRSNWAGGPR